MAFFGLLDEMDHALNLQWCTRRHSSKQQRGEANEEALWHKITDFDTEKKWEDITE